MSFVALRNFIGECTRLDPMKRPSASRFAAVAAAAAAAADDDDDEEEDDDDDYDNDDDDDDDNDDNAAAAATSDTPQPLQSPCSSQLICPHRWCP